MLYINEWVCVCEYAKYCLFVCLFVCLSVVICDADVRKAKCDENMCRGIFYTGVVVVEFELFFLLDLFNDLCIDIIFCEVFGIFAKDHLFIEFARFL